MSICRHDTGQHRNRRSESVQRIRHRPWRGLRATSHRPRLELLETRVVLSPTIFTVDSTGSGTSGSGMSGTLPYVISQANGNTNTDGSEIEFDSSLFTSSSPQTITLGATLMLSETAGPEMIEGPGAGVVTISGGGAVQVFDVASGVTSSISGVAINGGSTTSNGGGLANYGTVTLTDCTVSGNSAVTGGGGVDNEGSATLTDCTVSGNSAGSGGGLANYGTATLTDCTISGNSAVEGGGIMNGLYVAVTQSTLTNNTAVVGGGIFNLDELTIISTAIASNSATSGGGGVISSAGTATLTDSTVADNTVGPGAGGGGLYDSGGTMVLGACTVFGNSAGGGSGGGGLFDPNTGAIATLTDTIIAGNVDPDGAPDDINGFNATDVTGSFNLIGTGGSGGILAGTDGNIVLSSLADLGLAPLGDYGGPTETIALLPGSAAIGVGTAVSGITTDERGFSLDTPPDIGAFQTQAGLVVNTTIDGTGSPSGELSLRQAVNLANVLDVAETITFDPTVFATPQTITLGATLVLSETGGPEVIDGPGAGLVTVSGNNTSEVFNIAGDNVVSMSGLSFIAGNGVFGGGLFNEGMLTITNTTFAGNSAAYGGAIYTRSAGALPWTVS
jgi:fibronectin-binding autotransporter adhesin